MFGGFRFGTGSSLGGGGGGGVRVWVGLRSSMDIVLTFQGSVRKGVQKIRRDSCDFLQPGTVKDKYKYKLGYYIDELIV